MEQLPNGFTLELPEGTFPLSTDSILLSSFIRLPKKAKVLDLGSGCGTLGLLLCAGDLGCHVTGIELDTAAHEAALQNIARNAVADRMESICADLRQVPEVFPAGSFSCCISNPPYFSGGPASKAVPLARKEEQCSMSALFRSAAWALKYGGDFFLVHRPERLGEIISQGAAYGLETKRLCLVRHNRNSPINLVLVQLRKGAKSGLIWEDLILREEDGQPSERYKQIYHL